MRHVKETSTSVNYDVLVEVSRVYVVSGAYGDE